MTKIIFRLYCILYLSIFVLIPLSAQLGNVPSVTKKDAIKTIKYKFFSQPSDISKQEMLNYLYFEADGPYSIFIKNELYKTCYFEALKANKTDSYQYFLDIVPVTNEKYSAIKALFIDSKWNEVVLSNNLNDYLTFSNEFPNSKYDSLAKEFITYYQLDLSDLSVLFDYLYKYPCSTFTESVKKAILDNLSKSDVLMIEKSELDYYIKYIEHFPNSNGVNTIRYNLDKRKINYQLWHDYAKDGRFLDYERIVLSNPKKYYLVKESKEYIKEESRYLEIVNSDWYKDYEEFISDFPNGYYTQEIDKKLEVLKAFKAEVDYSYKNTIKGKSSPWSNVVSPVFFWGITFSERGNNIKYRIKGKGWYYDNNGEKWGNEDYIRGATEIVTGEYEVLPGKSITHETWFGGERFIGGKIIMDFTGFDAAGNKISFTIKIDCN